MADYVMPSLGADMESATLTTWLVKPGDTVKRGDVVATVETTKGIMDIEIFDAGVIDTLVAAPGTEVAVGGLLATYKPSGAAAASPAVAPARGVAPPVAPAVQAAPMPAAGPAAERRRVSPAARKRAAELGVDLDALRPQAGGAITLEDVDREAAAKARQPALVTPTNMRRQIAQSMSRAKREIPHYYLGTTVDLTNAMRWLATENAARPVTERLLYGVLLLKAVACALERFPELNGFWRDDAFEPAKAINVGTAIRLRQGGLVAPALPATNQQPLPSLMRSFQDLVLRARTEKLRATELASATITVTSLGEGSVETVYPIIYPPQVAIVGFGTVVVRPWVVAGAVVAAPVIHATLAADHRVTDGTRGSAFLMAVADRLQRPEEL
jgi:pyruvate dehydrogenase E2 component (dihydrolipoyllysine-residue acetyltransferase)